MNLASKFSHKFFWTRRERNLWSHYIEKWFAYYEMCYNLEICAFKIHCNAKITIAPTISAWPDPRLQHPASSEKSNVNSKVRRSAVGATRFATRRSRLVSSRAREQNGGTTRGNRQREERGRPPRLDTERRKQGQKGRETDEDSAREDNTRATSPTRREKVRHVANHVTGIRRGVRQNYADWAGLDPTTGNWLRTNVPRASLLQVVGVWWSFDFERSSSAGAWIAS